MPDNPHDPHRELRRKFREIMSQPDMLWGMEIEPYDLFEKDTRLPLASINLANEEGLIAEACGRYRITIKGYDEDPRQLFEIPEVRAWFAELDKDAPYFPYFLEPELNVVYAAALLEHSYQNAELRFEREIIQAYALDKTEAIERFCEEARVSADPALRNLYLAFGMLPRPSFPEEDFLLPERALLFAFDLGAATESFGEGVWRRVDLSLLAALGAVAQRARERAEAPPELVIFGHLGEGFFGAFLAGAGPEEAELVAETLKARFPPRVLSEPEEIAPTRQALPLWALRGGQLLRCLEEDPEEGPALLAAAFDGEEWALEAFEPEPELLEEVIDPIPGVELVVARVRSLE